MISSVNKYIAKLERELNAEGITPVETATIDGKITASKSILKKLRTMGFRAIYEDLCEQDPELAKKWGEDIEYIASEIRDMRNGVVNSSCKVLNVSTRSASPTIS